MKLPLRIAMICFLVSVGILLGFWAAGEITIGTELSAFWNMLLLIVAIALSVFMVKRQANFEEKPFVDDLKIGMQGGMVFVVLLTVFTYVFHEKIDSTYVEDRLSAYLDNSMKNVPNEETYKKMQAEDPTWKDKSYLDYLENQEDKATVGFSAGSFATGHLGIGLFLAIFFSLAITFVIRKVMLRDI